MIESKQEKIMKGYIKKGIYRKFSELVHMQLQHTTTIVHKFGVGFETQIDRD